MGLVKQAQKGNSNAFVELIEQNKMAMYKVAKSYLYNEEDAADAMQDTVLAVYEHIGQLKEPKYFKTWITRILLNCICQDRRKAQTVSLDEYTEKGVENYLIEEKIDLYDAIDSLKENYKTAVILFYFQELKIKEIARIMGIPDGNVKVCLYRAKKQLKNLLSNQTTQRKEGLRYAK